MLTRRRVATMHPATWTSVFLQAVALQLLLTATYAQSLIVVDDDGGPTVDFTDLGEAVTAAGDGDVLHVKPGKYKGICFEALGTLICSLPLTKPITIDFESGAELSVYTGVYFDGLPAGKTVTIRGLHADWPIYSPGRVFGTVWLEDCSFKELYLQDCEAVVISRCEARGTEGHILAPAWPGLITTDSDIFSYSSFFEGANGTYDLNTGMWLPYGASAVAQQGGFVWLAGGAVKVGEPGNPSSIHAHAVQAGSDAQLYYKKVAFAGSSDQHVLAEGNAAELLVPHGSLRTLDRLVKEGEAFEVSVRGEPHSTYRIMGRFGSEPRFFGSYSDVLGPDADLLASGVLGSRGSALVAVLAPYVGGASVRALHLQAFFESAGSGTIYESTPTFVTVRGEILPGDVLSSLYYLKLYVKPMQLAGRSLAVSPFFEHVNEFAEGDPISMSLDLNREGPLPAAGDYRVYVTENRLLSNAAADRVLVDARGDFQIISVVNGSLEDNIVLLDNGSLAGWGSNGGRGYDIVIDVDMSGTLSPGDVIDGLGERPGFSIVSGGS